MITSVIHNDRDGWQNVWKNLKDALPLENEIVDLEVTVNKDNDVTNLRYAFPVISFLKRKAITPRLVVYGDQEQIARAKVFLSDMIHSGVLVLFDRISTPKEDSVLNKYFEKDKNLSYAEKYRVISIIANSNRIDKRKNAKNTFTNYDSTDSQVTKNIEYYLYFTYPRNMSKRQNGDDLINIDLLKQSVSEIKNISIEKICVEAIDFYEDNCCIGELNKKTLPQLYGSDIFPLLEMNIENNETDLSIKRWINIYKNNTINAEKAEDGAPEWLKNNFDCYQKSIRDNLPDFRENDFAELIFYFLLRNLYSSKRIYQKKELKANIDLINKIDLDARSYAEGVYQLIENANIHSSGKTAFFGMRIYKADSEQTMGKLAKEANTRDMLWKKYWLDTSKKNNNIFNETDDNNQKLYRDFIEFYVLDDAINDEGKPAGILDTIHNRSNILKDNSSVSSIADVFSLTEEAYVEEEKINYYVKHYGMRWLHKHVENLNGIIQLVSPCDMEKIIYKGNQYVIDDHLGSFCYSNLFEDGYVLNGKKISKNSLVITEEGLIGEVVGVYDRKSVRLLGFKDTYNINSLKKLTRVEFVSTEYSILIPISYEMGTFKKNNGTIQELLFDTRYNFYADVETKMIKCTNWKNAINKEDRINYFEKELQKGISQWPINTHNKIPYLYIISLNECMIFSPMGVEVLAKTLIKHIYQHRSWDSTLLFAIDFTGHKELISEFVRVFSIFYSKQGYNTYMKNTQIAICSEQNKCRMINFVIAGENLRMAYNTAVSFVYHNAEASLEYVPLLDYLCPGNYDDNTDIKNKEDIGGVTQPICPFDLILRNVDFEVVKGEVEAGVEKRFNPDVLYCFLRHMYNKLIVDLRSNNYGCKLDNVHVRLGSKIHIDKFYEAELLFHNVGNVKRFAYMIARDIVKYEIDNDQIIALIGYEDYSSILVQEVVRLLVDDSTFPSNNVFWVIDSRSSGKFPEISFENIDQEIKQKIIKQMNKKTEEETDRYDTIIKCFTIVPIGTTLSTFYKLRDSFTRGLLKLKGSKKDNNPKIEFTDNHLLVAVGQCFVEKKIDETSRKYIDTFPIFPNCNKDWAIVRSNPDKEGGKPIEVKYCLGVESNWHDPSKYKDKPYDSENQKPVCPVIHVDKTNTLLQTIFQTPLSNKVLEYYNQASNINLLKPNCGQVYVKYGHTYKDNNHFQFYFDFEKIMTNSNVKKGVKEWTKKIKIDKNAFNIVVSPLKKTNSVFLKLIIDKVFSNSLHLLHIDINELSKESIRTKFNYLSEEIKRISKTCSKINFYYIDDSVCTGATIARACKLLVMLCDAAGVRVESLHDIRFNKVFLLINRNSYETAREWVNDPNEDWCGFIHLCVPPYNTNSNGCPACRIQKEFKLLAKRSATKEMTRYFLYNSNKHMKRTPKDYDDYINSEIINNHSYFSWYKSFVFTHEKLSDKFLDETYKIFRNVLQEKRELEENEAKNKVEGDDNKSSDLTKEKNNFSKHLDECLNIYREKYEDIIDVKDISDYIRKKYIEIMNCIIGYEHYHRLKSMDEAYRKIIYNAELHRLYSRCTEGISTSYSLNFSEYKRKLTKQILGMLKQSMTDNNYYDNVISFISYIKVISRDYIAHNYFIREAIFEILHCIFILLTEDFRHKHKMSSPELFKYYIQKYIEEIEPQVLKVELINLICNDEYVEEYFHIWKVIRNTQNLKAECRIQQYRAFKTVVHRLAKLNSEYIIRKEVIEDAILAYIRLDKCIGIREYLSEDDVVLSYLASIKTAAMSIDDDSMCKNLLYLYKDGIGYEV